MHSIARPARIHSNPLAALGGMVRRHRVVAFVVLAWALSWMYWATMLARGEVASPGSDASQFPGLFGPMVAALFVTAAAGGRGALADLVGRTLRWRVALRWYALAAVPFVLFLAGAGFLAATGGSAPTLDQLATYSGLPRLGLGPVVLIALLGCFGEEIGWRGFVQAELRPRLGVLGASLAVATVWATWHLPVVPVVESYRQMGFGVVPMLILGLGSGAIVLGWLYDRSGGSILITVLFHLGLNMGSATLAGKGLPAALATTGVMVWAVLIIIAELRPGRRPAAGTTEFAPSRRARFASLRDATVRVLLRSPFRRLLGPGMLLVTYRGRRTGHSRTIPVQYVRDADRVLVFVAQPSRKQWWRNVEEDQQVELTIDGRRQPARAVVQVGADARATLATCAIARPHLARLSDAAEAPVVVCLEAG